MFSWIKLSHSQCQEQFKASQRLRLLPYCCIALQWRDVSIFLGSLVCWPFFLPLIFQCFHWGSLKDLHILLQALKMELICVLTINNLSPTCSRPSFCAAPPSMILVTYMLLSPGMCWFPTPPAILKPSPICEYESSWLVSGLCVWQIYVRHIPPLYDDVYHD